MRRRPRNEQEFLSLERKFFSEVKRPVPKTSWEVFATFVVAMKGWRVEIEFVNDEPFETQPRPRQDGYQKAASLMTDLVFTPPPWMVKKVVNCVSTGRIAYYLNNGLQVIDDANSSLAVHITTCENLALDLVKRKIKIREAKQRPGYLQRILHKGDWKDRCLKKIAEGPRCGPLKS